MIKENPNEEDGFWLKGDVLNRLGKFQEAINVFDNGLEINPKHVDSWVGKGTSLKKLKKYQEAIQCYDKALELITEEFGEGHTHEVALIEGAKCKKLLKQELANDKKT